MLPDLLLPSVRTQTLRGIWHDSDAFRRFRGTQWMPQPCRSCEHSEEDLGGCRCQAFLVTGDAAVTDPACARAPAHARLQQIVLEGRLAAAQPREQVMVFRSDANSLRLSGGPRED
jgi:pyrroloquinoline quinone biosynthesis protein E